MILKYDNIEYVIVKWMHEIVTICWCTKKNQRTLTKTQHEIKLILDVDLK